MTDHTPDMVLVPREPTEAMLDAYWHGEGESREMRLRIHERSKRFWSAMLSASPLGASGEGEKSAGQRAFEWMRDTNNALPGATKDSREWSDLSAKDRADFQEDATRRPSLYHLDRPAPSTTSTAEQPVVGWQERAERAEKRIADLAHLFGVPDGGRYLNDWLARSATLGGRPASLGVLPDQTFPAEREVGRAIYERIERLTADGAATPELAYLSELVESVEEVGGYDGPSRPTPATPEGLLSDANIDRTVRTLEALADELSETLGARAQEGGGGGSEAERDLLRAFTRVLAALQPQAQGGE